MKNSKRRNQTKTPLANPEDRNLLLPGANVNNFLMYFKDTVADKGRAPGPISWNRNTVCGSSWKLFVNSCFYTWRLQCSVLRLLFAQFVSFIEMGFLLLPYRFATNGLLFAVAIAFSDADFLQTILSTIPYPKRQPCIHISSG